LIAMSRGWACARGEARSGTGARAAALAAALAVLTCGERATLAQEPTAPAPVAEAGALTDEAPMDEAARAEQRQAGVLGLTGWTVLGVGGGLWLALRWRRTHRR